MPPESPVQTDTCTECGQPIPADARTFGLCPRCLIGLALGAKTAAGGGTSDADDSPPAIGRVFGDGDEGFFSPLARALDITAHELTHGIQTGMLWINQAATPWAGG